MAFAGRALGLFVLGLLLAGAAPKPWALHQLLGQMRAASGEPYRYNLTSTSREIVDGAQTSVQTEFSGLQFRTRVCDGVLCRGSYFDGTRFYNVDINDTALPSLVQDPDLRAVRVVTSGLFLSSGFARGGTLSDLGTIQLHGTPYRGIGVSMPGLTPMVALVDPRTHLIAALRDWHGNVLIELRDYRTVGPLALPFSIYQDGVLVRQYETRTIAAEPFTRPRGITAQPSPSSAPVSIAQGSSTPVFACTLAQVRTTCLIDTGNSGMSISVELAERLQLPSLGEFEVAGLGRYATEVVRAGPLLAGGAEFPSAYYVVLHDIHQYGYDVVLGADALAASNVTIDYPARTVSFGGQSEIASASVIALGFMNFVPVVPIRLSNTPALLAVDTGDESTINLSYDYYRKHTDLFSLRQSRGVNGVGGSSVELLGEIASVQFGDYRVESQEIGTTRTLHATGEGHLGAGFLSHFRVVLDYNRGRLGLTPRSGDASIHPRPEPR
ncbi:MAG: hypothetical protein NVS9B12_08420 [Vulcanimicrobiaceae bacterium]